MESSSLSKSSASSSKVYHQFARYYDRFFEPVYRKRIFSTIESLDIPAGANVLEVGVGTGISLPAYPEGINVVGIDLSEKMLEYAAARAETETRANVQLQQMDAQNLEFPDEHFDYVMAFHVVSVVPDVDRMMREMHRVCKTNGKMVVINHFRSRRRWLAAMIDKATPITKSLGWRTDLGLEEMTRLVPMRVEQQYKTSSASLFTVLVATKPNGSS